MSYKKSKRCSVCKRCNRVKQLEIDIAESRYFYPMGSGMSLMKISEAYRLNYQSVRNHVKQHQMPSLDSLSDVEMRRLAKRAEMKTVIQEAPLPIVQNQNTGAIKANAVWDNVIDSAMEQVKSGEIKLNANHLLKAAKDKSDFDIKKKNQDMALMEMMWHFASGEAGGSTDYDRRIIEGQEADDYNAAEITANSLNEWENRPGTIYNGTAGDAPASGPDKVFEGHDF